MTVKTGDDWGERVPLPAHALSAATDRQLAALVARGETTPIVVRGGDLYRTLGSPPPTSSVLRLPIDVVRVTVDGEERIAVAHVLARRSGAGGWWRGPILAVMNTEHRGRWDVAPRAHPNDGRADVVVVKASMPVRERWQAWRRLPSGTHVPHPSVAVRRVASERFVFDRPLAVWIDGESCGSARTIAVMVEADAAIIHV